MTTMDILPGDAAELRRRAEEIAWGKATRMSENPEVLSPEETRRTLHELRVHQIELEMQNEELRQTQGDLEMSQARYFNLYNLAPVGYITLDRSGLILEVNLTATSLLGVARSTVIQQPLTRFLVPEDQDSFYLRRKELLRAGMPQALELRLTRPKDVPFWARLEMTAAQEVDGTSVCRAVISDITVQKQIETGCH
jgi:two-component system cell cycle sensor histidine kinase/response regulator CckA